jgi:hypothetical protein
MSERPATMSPLGLPVTAPRAKRENGGLGEDPPGSTMTQLTGPSDLWESCQDIRTPRGLIGFAFFAGGQSPDPRGSLRSGLRMLGGKLHPSERGECCIRTLGRPTLVDGQNKANDPHWTRLWTTKLRLEATYECHKIHFVFGIRRWQHQPSKTMMSTHDYPLPRARRDLRNMSFLCPIWFSNVILLHRQYQTLEARY